MPRCLKLVVCFNILSMGATMAQTIDQPEAANSSSPVAYVYVSRPTHIDAFAAASDGKLTLIGSPITGSVSHMSVTKKFLFGLDDNNQNIDTFTIESNGAITYLTDVNAQSFIPDACAVLGPIKLDQSGATLYNSVNDGCQDAQGYQAYKIESDGHLQYLKTTFDGGPPDVVFLAPITFLGNNKFGYQVGCADDDGLQGNSIAGVKRTSTGTLETFDFNADEPNPKNPADNYCAGVSATDTSDHLAVSLQEFNFDQGEYVGPLLLAILTADSKGNLTTKSTYENMAATSLGYIGTMSISPSSKLLAVGGSGFQVFHFDGGSQPTKLTGKISTNGQVQGFAWDNKNHLYVLSTKDLYVYDVSSTSVKPAPGSPYSIPEASSLIVLDK
jgi:hypothetical protein